MLPDIDRRIVFREVATPLTHRRYIGANGGTPFGIATSPEQMLHNRPGPRTAIRGLYLCGANCRSGPGIVGVTVSGLMTAEAILRERIVTKVLRG